MLRDYLKWLRSVPRALWGLLTDRFLLLGAMTGAFVMLCAYCLSGRLVDPWWARALGAFVAANGALFCFWRALEYDLGRRDE